MTGGEHSLAAMSETEWAQAVAAQLGIEASEDIAHVESVLLEHGIRPGRPRAPHRLRVLAAYFAGIKHVSASSASTEHGEDDVSTVDVPFAFAHEFDDGFTAFATNRINDAGKSTILGVILWALHGKAPVPTLQADVRSRWMREAAVLFDVDGVRHLTTWRIEAGTPSGGIYVLSPGAEFKVGVLRTKGLEAAAIELDTLVVAGTDADLVDGDAVVTEFDIADSASQVKWPANEQVETYLELGTAASIALFNTEDEFEAAVSGVMLDRLDLEPVLVYTKNPGALDESDGKVTQHGWGALSQALSIIDPTTSAVLGEHSILIQHLMAVFLGSGWSQPAGTAHRLLRKTNGEIAARRRRRAIDRDANEREIDTMKDQLAELNLKLSAFGDVPAFDAVMVAAAQANADAVAAAQAHRRMLKLAATWGDAERAREEAVRDLHALTEAVATRRFFHSLRPSCCPRCDADIDVGKWAREKEGHCSLCDSEFIGAAPEESTAVEGQASAHVASGDTGDLGDEEDQLAAMRRQVDELASLAVELDAQHDAARSERERLDEIAERSASLLASLDRAVSEERYNVERQISRLEGRIAEREALAEAAEDGGDDSDHLEFAQKVFQAARTLAVTQRDEEQKETLLLVSDVLTRLGSEFGIRNLEKATLRANGHLPVVKGGETENFSGLNAGERLRLKIALIVGLLSAGSQTGRGRHPGLLVVDDLTTHEINPGDVAKIANSLYAIDGLQFLTASTLGPELIEVVGQERVVMPAEGDAVLF
ncbi:hypothetical protein [Mycolicibacterium mucogenicum]|uniref:Uncharacterized protein n=2 Tax=Mycolicibacterium mucogenicum DSM 44124 TaxID=1226753 RepID=A0A8E4R9Q3_MYCMU|nr:hypothetical protein [Mycolicibacterium mucogenicum]KAB7761804.1 hypothetical protein MMUC44124_01870 [Mycolicibacterium mucogenicum DSM 44124]QPG70155.1 hypothetical protein C1S78_003820 [Mycolicibacterium mucogenicum DSM 44124]